MWHANCKVQEVQRWRGLIRALAVAIGLSGSPDGAAWAAPPVPAPPGSAAPQAAVLRHLAHVADHINTANPADDVGRRTLGEAKVSFAAANARQASGDYAAADQLAASADDLVRASDSAVRPPPPGRDPGDAAQILARVDLMASALSTVRASRVRTLIDLARDVEGSARRKAAGGASDALAEALRAEAIARAAVHVAIAADPAVLPGLLPPPRSPKPPKPPESSGEGL